MLDSKVGSHNVFTSRCPSQIDQFYTKFKNFRRFYENPMLLLQAGWICFCFYKFGLRGTRPNSVIQRTVDPLRFAAAFRGNEGWMPNCFYLRLTLFVSCPKYFRYDLVILNLHLRTSFTRRLVSAETQCQICMSILSAGSSTPTHMFYFVYSLLLIASHTYIHNHRLSPEDSLHFDHFLTRVATPSNS